MKAQYSTQHQAVDKPKLISDLHVHTSALKRKLKRRAALLFDGRDYRTRAEWDHCHTLQPSNLRDHNGLTFNRLNWKLNPLHTLWRRQMHWFLDLNVTLCLSYPRLELKAPPLEWMLNTVAARPTGAMNQLTAVAWQDLSSSIGSPTLLTIGILLLRCPVLIFEPLHDQFIFLAAFPSLPLTAPPQSAKSLSTFSPLPSPVLS